tara:strand:+ start:1100 stop:1639 length:540 start_codon:yes stop_codon:yes gene_type:complete
MLLKQEQKILPQMFFDKLNNILNGDRFQWFFNSSSLNANIYPFKKNNNFMFTHMLFMDGEGQTSRWFDMFEPITYFINEKIKVNKLLRMKLNLYTNQNRTIHQPSHYDVTDLSNDEGNPLKGIKTGVLNFTTCNGGTKVGNTIYPSNANEMLIFDNTLKHNGLVQTDTPVRIILNINWE